ncbi:MAG: hypothetical protein WCR56_02905 [Bacilli bacterium]
MKNSMFAYLLWANPKNSANSEEQIFYDTNARYFNMKLSDFNDNSSLFGIIRSDIVLKGLVNKDRMDKDILSFNKEQLDYPFIKKGMHHEMPYLDYNGQKIYIPTYSPAINEKYENSPAEMLDFPYNALLRDNQASLVDPFETYGNSLFSSSFTRLVRLKAHDEDSNAFYHPEFKTLFVIDDKGGLEQEIPLVDEKLKMFDGDNLFERLDLLMTDYYSNNRDGFLAHLLSLGLISKALFSELKDITNLADSFQKKRISK